MSGKITNNNGDLSKAFFGTAEVEKIFLGNTELYSKAAPAGYVIPAGLYYGKSSPDLISGSVLTGGSLPFTSNNQSFNGLGVRFEEDTATLRYVGTTIVNAYSESSGWTSAYRTIEVTSDTTVTQYEYNAFFACFDYAFTVRLETTGATATFGFTDNMTWEDFVNSSYNDGNFSAEYNYVNYVAFTLTNGYGDSYVRPNDIIIHSHQYLATGGGN